MKKKILIVDDEHDIVIILKMALEKEGYEVEEAFDGVEALEKVTLFKPDLILLDIMMPDKDGLTLLKEIKELDKDVSVAMITAYRDAEHVIDAFRLGAMDCLLKPFNLDYIQNTVLPRVRVRPK